MLAFPEAKVHPSHAYAPKAYSPLGQRLYTFNPKAYIGPRVGSRLPCQAT